MSVGSWDSGWQDPGLLTLQVSVLAADLPRTLSELSPPSEPSQLAKIKRGQNTSHHCMCLARACSLQLWVAFQCFPRIELWVSMLSEQREEADAAWVCLRGLVR